MKAILVQKGLALIFLIFGLIGSVPFFFFNYCFYFAKGMFNGFRWKYRNTDVWSSGLSISGE